MDVYRTPSKSVVSLLHEGNHTKAYVMLHKLLEYSTSEAEKTHFENIYALYFTPQGTLNKINKKLSDFVNRINCHRNSAEDNSVHIGINVGHNATISVVQGEKIVFLQSEERLSRLKNHLGFPFKTLEALKGYLDSTEVGSISFHGCTNSTLKFLLDEQNNGSSGFAYGSLLDPELVRRTKSLFRDNGDDFLSTLHSMHWAKLFTTECNGNIRRAGREYLRSLFSEFEGKKAFNFVPHHLCHAMSVIPFLSDRVDITHDRLAIFTLDAEGDFFSGSVILVDDGEFEVIEQIPAVFSVGNMVHYATGILGMKMGEHEYKLMGLAPYANKNDSELIKKKLLQIVDFDENGEWTSSWDLLKRNIIQSPWQMETVLDSLSDTLMCERFDNVAGGLQTYLEEVVIRWISATVGKLDVSNVALAGGVFANVKLNQKIRQLPCVKTLAITPSPGDESGAIGASIIGNTCASGLPSKRTTNLYLGHSSSESSIVDALNLARDNSLIIKPIESEAELVPQLLEMGEVVGRAVGPMEFGQRSLGNRSILANPSRPGVPEKINHYVKNRDFWMPFAPTIIHPYHETLIYDDDKYTSAFMMIGQDVQAPAIDSIRNAMHPRDFTARPQILRRADNVAYYDIILAFFEKTGVPAVLNTSFNLHGEPIVANAVDAVDVFLRCSLKYLVIDGYLIEKP